MLTNTPNSLTAILALTETLETLKALDLQSTAAANLVPLIKAVQSVAAFSAAVDAEIQRRAIGNGELLPGVVTKTAVTHRRWHDDEAAAELAQEQFGDKAFERKLKSPAQIEKLEGGETFVAVASFKPEGKKVASY